MASPTSPTTNLPSRTSTMEDDAIPDEDSSEVTKLFHERLQAWKHACGYLEDYITSTEKMQATHSKEYEKVLKTVNSPLKEGHHFDQQNGGIAQMFENIRANTQGISNSHAETAKTLKGSVLPIFARLHQEIKAKTKELSKGAGKSSKAVDKARNDSQKSIELLGQHSGMFAAQGGSTKANDDPYVLHRQVYHRLHRQVLEENNNRDDMISVQNSFAQFEAHIVQTIQQGLQQFNQVLAHQCDQSRGLYGDMTAMSSSVPHNFEWNGFIRRNDAVLIDPSTPKRSVENIKFANQDHESTQPLIAGSLERKGKLLKRYDAGFYVVTPSKYLHEFKTDDDFAKDPSPEQSLYLPDCLIGALDGTSFNIKGKDASKSTLGNKMSMSHELSFRAHTPADAQKWHQVISMVAAGNTSAANSVPSSPTTGNTISPGQSTIAPTTAAAGPTTTTTDLADKEAAGASQGVATSDAAQKF